MYGLILACYLITKKGKHWLYKSGKIIFLSLLLKMNDSILGMNWELEG